ncbi:MAG: hypothetical protein GY771_02750, partial [bacterium]|nr:hypothetical protein [bacterium]
MGKWVLILLLSSVGSAYGVTFDEAADIAIAETAVGAGEVVYGLGTVLREGTRVDGWWESVTFPYDGYLFLYDPAPDMLWGHDCKWVIVAEDDGVLTTYDMQTPPDTLFGEMVIVAGEEFGAGFEPEASFPAQMRFFDDDERLISGKQFEGRRHALLISGGRDKETNSFCFWGNIAFIYRTLLHYYGWDKSDIKVLISDGDDPAPDRKKLNQLEYESSPLDLDGDKIPDYDTPADKENVIAALDDLTAKVAPGDLVFIFVAHHGTRPPGWIKGLDDLEEVGVCLWGPYPEHNLWDYELADYLDQLPDDAVKIVSVFSCFSGGFIDEIEDNGTENVVICTPCRAYEGTGSGGYLMEMVHYWMSAFNWATEDIYSYPESVDADTDDDGICQVDEAFDWMVDNHFGFGTPQWYDSDGIGDNAVLYGDSNGPIVILDLIDNNDDAPYGNGDGYFERGEEVATYVTLRNVGRNTAEGVSAEIICSDADVEITSGTADYPDIGPGCSVTNTAPLLVGVKGSLSYNKAADIDIEYTLRTDTTNTKSSFIPLFYDKELIGLYDDVEGRGFYWAEEGTGQWDIRENH